jgi:hypothetical protein
MEIFKLHADIMGDYRQNFDQVATDRSTALVSAHDRFSNAVGGSRYEVVTPVFP